jgi:transposase
MAPDPVGFTLNTLTRKKLEKWRRKQKDARLHNRLSALLWLSQGRSVDEVAELLGVCPRTIANWLQLYQSGGLERLLTLDYQGDPG